MTRSTLAAEQLAQLVEQAEVGVGKRVRLHGREFDQQVDIALARAEVVAQSRPEDVEPDHAEVRADLGDGLLFVAQDADHGSTSADMLPSSGAADHSGRTRTGA